MLRPPDAAYEVRNEHPRQLEQVSAQARRAEQVPPLEAATEAGPRSGAQGNSWAIFKTFLDAVADAAAAPVAAKYTGVLAAADVFTRDNAWTLLESLRIDTGVLGPFGIRP
ncbi:hypothetical protein AB5J52_17380 [Streptomyces sp. R39]|uniref:Uncharacterized protein n=1 Tax=Streptomyces sp. R39 TaxID=3238631 RepID=A0AB39QNI5_9ACTN